MSSPRLSSRNYSPNSVFSKDPFLFYSWTLSSDGQAQTFQHVQKHTYKHQDAGNEKKRQQAQRKKHERHNENENKNKNVNNILIANEKC